MDGKLPDIKPPSKEDIELIRNRFLANSYPINMSMSNEETKKKTEEGLALKIINEQIKSFEKGYQFLVEEIMKKAVDGLYSNDPTIKPIAVESFQLTPDMISEIKKIMKTEPISSTVIHDYCDFSTDVQLLFYEIANEFYDQALYEKSIDAFCFLTTINPDVQAFWIGLALGYEKNLALDKAVEKFKIAIAHSDPADFSPYYGLIRCCESLQDYKEIEELLEAAKDNKAIKEEVEVALEYLKTKK